LLEMGLQVFTQSLYIGDCGDIVCFWTAHQNKAEREHSTAVDADLVNGEFGPLSWKPAHARCSRGRRLWEAIIAYAQPFEYTGGERSAECAGLLFGSCGLEQ
jgi:hypothetical protein